MSNHVESRLTAFGTFVVALCFVLLVAVSLFRDDDANITVRSCTGATGASGAPGATGPTGATGPSGKIGPKGSPGASGHQGAPGAAGPAGATGATGAPGIDGVCSVVTGAPGVNGKDAPMFYGSFYSTYTEQLVNQFASAPMRLSQTVASQGVTLTDSSNTTCTQSPYCNAVMIENAGVYNIQFSAQLSKVAGNSYITSDIWLAKKSAGTSNFADLPWTATEVFVPNDTDYSVAAWNFMVTASARDEFQLRWSSTHAQWANLRITSGAPGGYPIGSAPPQIPGLIVTVQSVGL